MCVRRPYTVYFTPEESTCLLNYNKLCHFLLWLELYGSWNYWYFSVVPEKDNEVFRMGLGIGGRATIPEKKRLEVHSDAHRLGAH